MIDRTPKTTEVHEVIWASLGLPTYIGLSGLRQCRRLLTARFTKVHKVMYGMEVVFLFSTRVPDSAEGLKSTYVHRYIGGSGAHEPQPPLQWQHLGHPFCGLPSHLATDLGACSGGELRSGKQGIGSKSPLPIQRASRLRPTSQFLRL